MPDKFRGISVIGSSVVSALAASEAAAAEAKQKARTDSQKLEQT